MCVLQLMLPTEQNGGTDSDGQYLQPTEPPKLPYNLLGISLLQLVTVILTCLAKNSPSIKASEASMERMGNTVDAFTSRGNDIIRYVVCLACNLVCW